MTVGFQRMWSHGTPAKCQTTYFYIIFKLTKLRTPRAKRRQRVNIYECLCKGSTVLYRFASCCRLMKEPMQVRGQGKYGNAYQL